MLRKGVDLEDIYNFTKIDKWFLVKLKKIIDQFKANGIRTSIFVDPEITSIILRSSIKFDAGATTKVSDTIKSDVITTITNYKYFEKLRLLLYLFHFYSLD